MGLFISAATLVQEGGKAFRGQPEATGENCLDSLKETAQILQQQGAKAILQIHHGGSKAIDELLDGLDKLALPPAKPNTHAKQPQKKSKHSSPLMRKPPIWRFVPVLTAWKSTVPIPI